MIGSPPPLRGAGRFAPTPTGRLHLGNARTALLAWLDARKAGLRTVLRVEDLDLQAIPPGCVEEQLADLHALGLRFDEGVAEGGPVGPYRQSQRFDLYAQALAALNQRGLLYRCTCSRKEIHDATRAPHASDEGPVYAGTCAPQEPEIIEDLTQTTHHGKPAALRLDVAAALRRLGWSHITWHDEAAGPQEVDIAQTMGDFIVRRRDGIPAYQLACAVDDATMGCTRVVRGADLLPSAARQILVLAALELPRPAYAHVGLVLDAAGQRLAKRDQAISLRGLLDAGRSGAWILRQLAVLSGLPPTADLDLLTEAFGPATLHPEPVHLSTFAD